MDADLHPPHAVTEHSDAVTPSQGCAACGCYVAPQGEQYGHRHDSKGIEPVWRERTRQRGTGPEGEQEF